MIKYLLKIIYLSLALGSLFLGSGCAKQCTTSGRYLVVRTFAGMANRLRLLASAKIMAALTDRQLVVDWPVINEELPGEWSDFFLNPITTFDQSPLALKDGCTLNDLKSATEGDPFVKNLGTLNDPAGQKRLSQITEDKEPIVYFGSSLNFQPDEKYISNNEYRERYRLYYQNLDPHSRVTKEVKQFQKDNDFENKYMVGVHYRAWQTGFADESQGVTQDKENKYLTLFIDEMKKAVALPASDTNNKPVAFFLATDDPNVKTKLLAVTELAGRIYTASFKTDRTTVEGQQNALIDFFLLGATNYILGTNQSSFSDEAAHLTKKNEKVNLGAAAYQPR